MLLRYETVAQDLTHADRAAVLQHLDKTLPDLWQLEYLDMPGSTTNLVTVTFGDDTRNGHFCRYLFDHASAQPPSDELTGDDVNHVAEDRVAAVWGTSRLEPAGTRDKSRMKGFLRGGWADTQDDRGHFFAHTMGGGLDINLFPQAARLNRSALWRRMERYCAGHPGTFCFVRPIYAMIGGGRRSLSMASSKWRAGDHRNSGVMCLRTNDATRRNRHITVKRAGRVLSIFVKAYEAAHSDRSGFAQSGCFG